MAAEEANVLLNHKTVKPGNHNCDSANVVYLIHCKKCLIIKGIDIIII